MRLLLLIFTLCASIGAHALLRRVGNGWEEVALKALVVKGEFFDSLGEVMVRQKWTNHDDVAVTSKYKFSLDTNAVVSGFQMKIGEQTWTGVVKAKDTARANFDAAVAAGVKSSILEKISDNEYEVEVGPISPSESAEIEFHYLTHAVVQLDGSYRFVLPTNIARKFTTPGSKSKAEQEYANKMAATPYASNHLYSFDVDLTWHTGSTFLDLLHSANPVEVDKLSNTAIRVRCVTAPENGDFSVAIKTGATTGAYSYENEEGTTYLYVHNQIPVEAVTTKAAKEITIVLDRSGSMQGSKMEEAKAAVDQFLHLLPVDHNTLINVVSFGSRFDAVYSHSVPATAANIAALRDQVRNFRADYGGTQLLECLRSVVSGQAIPHTAQYTPNIRVSGSEHVVLLLTDGQIDNLNAVLSLLKNSNLAPVRIMTIGIGRDADRKLVQQIADTTHALCRVLVDEADLTRALTDVLSYIDKQYYTNMRVLDYEVSQVASVLYPAHPVDMFLRLSPQQYQEVSQKGLIITADDPVRRGTVKAWHIPVANILRVGRVLEKLYADHTISQLSKQIDDLNGQNYQRGQQLTASIVDVSVKHGIMNRHTSFLVISNQQIGPEERARAKKTEVPQHESAHMGRGDISLSSGASAMGSSGSVHVHAAHARFASQPSLQPSAQPSFQPSSQPSCAPSRQPTTRPSAQPTSLPSASPSAFPTAVPSAVPSAAPSAFPTAVPSAVPSAQPSFFPTVSPSAVPSAVPSVFPTASPSVVPTTACPNALPFCVPPPSVLPAVPTSSSFRSAESTVSVDVDQDGTLSLPAATKAAPAVAAISTNSLTLKAVEAHGMFLDSLGELSAVHKWTNTHSASVVGHYNVTLDARAVVSDLIVKVGGNSTRGVLSLTATAQAAFDAAVQGNTVAALLSKVSDTVYQVQVGPVHPSESLEVELHYLINLATKQSGVFRLDLPNNLAPLVSADVSAARLPHAFEVNLTWHTSRAVRSVLSANSDIITETSQHNTAHVRCTTAPTSGDFSVTLTSAGSAEAYSHESTEGSVFMFHLSDSGDHVYQRLAAAEYKTATEKGITVTVDASSGKTKHVPIEAITRTGQILEKLYIQHELAAQCVQNKISTLLVGMSMAHGIVDTKMSLLARV